MQSRCRKNPKAARVYGERSDYCSVSAIGLSGDGGNMLYKLKWVINMFLVGIALGRAAATLRRKRHG